MMRIDFFDMSRVSRLGSWNGMIHIALPRESIDDLSTTPKSHWIIYMYNLIQRHRRFYVVTWLPQEPISECLESRELIIGDPFLLNDAFQ